VHLRSATDDLLEILRSEDAAEVGGVMHCFTEDWDTAQKAIAMNFVISFSGIVTFKNAVPLQKIAARLPLEKMLLETDSPYLAPVPYRGKPNQPAYLVYVAECIAKLRNITVNELAQSTSNNFLRIFAKKIAN
jgi:TatD DNase family protein